ncbi:FtsK/SpoIIIE domain-containing protein [Dermacoccaceae bacterium W4C1]
MPAGTAAPARVELTLMLHRTDLAVTTAVVVIGDSSTTWDVLLEQQPHLAERTWYAGQVPIAGTATLGQAPLLHCAALTDRPIGDGPAPLVHLGSAEGPTAGALLSVDQDVTIGRDPGSRLCLVDPALSRQHAVIRLRHGRIQAFDLGSTNGTTVDGIHLKPGVEHELKLGQRMHLGTTTLRLVTSGTQRPTLVSNGRRSITRPPRHLPELAEQELQQPTPPEVGDRRLPWLLLLFPVPISLALALFLDSMMFLAFGLFGPMMMLGHYLHEKREGRGSRRQAFAAFQRSSEDFEQHQSQALAREVQLRRRLSPDLLELLMMARAARCWEVTPGDADYLSWRLGVAEVDSGLTVRHPDGRIQRTTLPGCPLTLDLSAHRTAGLFGEPAAVSLALQGLIGQCAVRQSPQVLRLILCTDRPAHWRWLQWLPHLRSDATSAPTILPMSHVDALEALCQSTQGPPRESGSDEPAVHAVLLVDCADRGLPVPLRELTNRTGPGVAVVIASEHPQDLPQKCTATVELKSLDDGSLTRSGDQDPIPFTPDLPAPGWREQVAAGLCPLVDVTPGVHAATLPARAPLADLPGGVATADEVAAQWHLHPTGTRFVIGLGTSGPVEIDLDRDGPHALIGGTTGAGKSELLQGILLSLARASRPDQLNFLLVDYKGGAAFQECRDLPHTVGLVTDLDDHETRRALTSLEAEIRRREKLLAAVGAADLPDYRRCAPASAPIIPKLVLVIDEFRVLAEELPDFMEGLVRLAAVGRSLGIHLVLATQRPGGIVSADIRANVSLRIALRVRDRSDSEDIIESPAAAVIPAQHPGRAILRTGAGDPVHVQTTNVSGSSTGATAVQVLEVDPLTGHVQTPAPPSQAVDTDLRRSVTAVAEAARQLGLTRAPSPWRPPLPELLARAEVSDHERQRVSVCVGALDHHQPSRVRGPAALLGLVDLPAEQDQAPCRWDLTSGHLALIGGPRSGRTLAARSVALDLALEHNADDLHLYVVDGAGSLAGLESLPHCGVVVPTHDRARLPRLVRTLAADVAQRLSRLSAAGLSDLKEWREREDDAPPYCVVIIDGWESVQDTYEVADAQVLDDLTEILRGGLAAGVSVLATGGRALISGRAAASLTHRICLATSDELDLVMAGLTPAQIPARMPPGRGLILPDAHEVQICVVGGDPTGAGQSAALREVTASAAQPSHHRPFTLAALPQQVHLAALTDLRASTRDGDESLGDGILLGIGGPEGQPVALAIDDGEATLLVAGRPGSGRTSCLLTIAAQLTERGPVHWLSGTGRAPTALSDHGIAELSLAAVDGPDGTDDELETAWRTLVIDDVEWADQGILERLVESHLQRTAAGLGALLIAGATDELLSSYHGPLAHLRRRSSGLLLGTRRGDGEVFGVDVPAAEATPPGRGHLARRGRTIPVQVALPPQPTHGHGQSPLAVHVR